MNLIKKIEKYDNILTIKDIFFRRMFKVLQFKWQKEIATRNVSKGKSRKFQGVYKNIPSNTIIDKKTV